MILLPQSLDDLDFYTEDPFFLFEKNNFLDDELYKKLNDTFPSSDELESSYYTSKGKKLRLSSKNPRFLDFIGNSSHWKSFYEEFSSQEMLLQMFNLWNLSDLPIERQKYYQNPWVHAVGRGKYTRKIHKLITRLIHKNSVRLSFEFSSIPNGGYIPPHTDVGGKLLSLLIYFPDDDFDYKGCSGTSFFKTRKGHNPLKSWNSNLLSGTESEKFYNTHSEFFRSEFTPNKLVGFVKTSLSWHTVETLKINGATRRCLGININTK